MDFSPIIEFSGVFTVQENVQVMKSPVVGFKAVERVETVVNTLRNTTHNGFPVFPADRQANFSLPALVPITVPEPLLSHQCSIH